MIEDIIMHAPNLGNLKQLVLMGESAGGYGVGFNCDLMASRFHEEMPGLDVRCVADAGDFYPPYMSNSDDCDVLTAMSQLASFYHSEVDASCFSGTWGPDNTELDLHDFLPRDSNSLHGGQPLCGHSCPRLVHSWLG